MRVSGCAQQVANIPVFTSSATPPFVFIPSQTVVTVTAIGAGTIVYSIAGGQDAALFTINSSTGVLTFIAASAADTYYVRVSAKNSGGAAYQNITISAGVYTGPLDVVPGATLAYGNRAMSNAALGTAIYTLRRSSDDTTQTFNSDATTGAAPVASINTFKGVGDAFASSWKDQSGNASHMLQATSGRQPVWQAALGDAQPSLQFVAAGADLLATAAAINLTDPGITVFTVMIPTEAGADLLSLDTFGEGWATSSGGMINYWQGRAAPDAVGVYVLNYLDDASGVGPVYTSSSLTEYNDGLIHLWDVALDGANAPYNGTLAVDGEAWPNTGDPGNAGFSGLSWRMALGNNDATRGLGAASYFDGQIFEFIVYPFKMSDANRALVRANIAAYYGITLS